MNQSDSTLYDRPKDGQAFNPVLLKIASAFPFSFSPDTITIEHDRLNFVCRELFGPIWTHSMFVDNVTNISVATSTLYATLEITDSTNPRNVITIRVRHIHPRDAFYAQSIIQGLLKVKRDQIDLSGLTHTQILERLAILGQAKSDQRPEASSTQTKEAKIPHYYGDIVRVLYFLASLIMLISLPFFQGLIPGPLYISIGAILILGFIAGLTNPIQRWAAVINMVIAFIGFLVFEYYAIAHFHDNNVFFFINQTLAVMFFFALYYSTKTVRGFYQRQTTSEQTPQT